MILLHPIQLALHLLVALALVGPVLEICFLTYYAVNGLRARGVWLPLSAVILGKVVYVIGAAADAFYNQTFGRYWFGQWTDLPWKTPGGPMFSNRVQWQIDHALQGKNLAAAIKWATLLNAVAPNHIKNLAAAILRQAGQDDWAVVDTHL